MFRVLKIKMNKLIMLEMFREIIIIYFILRINIGVFMWFFNIGFKFLILNRNCLDVKGNNCKRVSSLWNI